jgi:hypothetical protein
MFKKKNRENGIYHGSTYDKVSVWSKMYVIEVARFRLCFCWSSSGSFSFPAFSFFSAAYVYFLSCVYKVWWSFYDLAFVFVTVFHL